MNDEDVKKIKTKIKQDNSNIIVSNDDETYNKNNSDITSNVNMQKELYNMLMEADFKLYNWIKLFDIYEKNYQRFFYHHISQYILMEKEEERIGQLIQNITIVTSRVFISEEERNKKRLKSGIPSKAPDSHGMVEVSYNKYLMIFKLYDHCNLANKQRLAYKTTKEDIEIKIRETATSTIKENEKLIHSKISDYEKSITSQLIGLVAIFTALSFVIFGGINTSATIFKMVGEVPIPKILILLDVWFICMSNLFILFMKMIATITDRHFKTIWYFLIINVILIVIFGVLLYAIRKASFLQ